MYCIARTPRVARTVLSDSSRAYAYPATSNLEAGHPMDRAAWRLLGRKGDGEPGVTVIWKGFQHLVDIAAMFKIFCPSQ